MPRTVGILGGMGPAAGADFLRLFVQACTALLARSGGPVTDQAYPEHWLAQLPVPDRTAALQAGSAGDDSPFAALRDGTARLQAAGADIVAMACNTAHAWHAPLQEAFPDLEVLDGVREVAEALARAGVRRAGLLATEGTYRSGLYGRALEAAGVECVVPDGRGRALLMAGIYEGVKAGDLASAREAFQSVARSLAQDAGCTTLVMGCTEIPLALGGAAPDGVALVDATQVMAQALAARAYGSAQRVAF